MGVALVPIARVRFVLGSGLDHLYIRCSKEMILKPEELWAKAIAPALKVTIQGESESGFSPTIAGQSRIKGVHFPGEPSTLGRVLAPVPTLLAIHNRGNHGGIAPT